MNELFSCPFCGGAATYDYDDDGWNWIVCRQCGVSTNASTHCGEDCRPKLAEAWNRRAVPALVQPEPSWEPRFDVMSPEQERLVQEFCAEIAGPRGKPGCPPDPVRLLEMAEALYQAERKDALAASSSASQPEPSARCDNPEAYVRAIAAHVEGWRTATFGWQGDPDPAQAERNKQDAIKRHAAECLRRVHAELIASGIAASASLTPPAPEATTTSQEDAAEQPGKPLNGGSGTSPAKATATAPTATSDGSPAINTAPCLDSDAPVLSPEPREPTPPSLPETVTLSDETLDRLTTLMLEWGRKQYWSSGAYSLKQFKQEVRSTLGSPETVTLSDEQIEDIAVDADKAYMADRGKPRKGWNHYFAAALLAHIGKRPAMTKVLPHVDRAWADEPTPKAQEGTWTLTAPDGRTWQAESPLRVCAKESRERVPAHVALARIARGCDEDAALSTAPAQPTTEGGQR